MHRVLYGDTDQMGVVYYANYLRFFEGARNGWIRALGVPYPEIEARGVLLPVLEASVHFLRPARFDDLLEVSVRASHTLVKIRFDYVVRRVGEQSPPPPPDAPALQSPPPPGPLCLGHTVHACVGRDGRVVRAPPWLLDALGKASTRRRVLPLMARAADEPQAPPSRD
jgi:acyl-CoA thioester hydrolase